MKLSPRMHPWLFMALSLMVMAYLATAWVFTSGASRERLCEGVLITVHDTADIHFVTPQELAAELGDLPQTARSTALSDIDIDSIERMLNHFDKIEKVNVNILSSGKILIDVWPMQPVARIFDSAGHSFYINRAGKRIKAEPGYYLDVPVIHGDFSPEFPATSLVNLLECIEADPDWNEAVSMIDARSPSDIILVPVIRGHVINIGDTTDIPDKLRRIKLMYSKVMGVKGWDFYKEISVKWRGQVVGIRRNAKHLGPEYILDEQNDEEATLSTAELDEGAPVHVSAEKPIPAAMKRKTSVNDTVRKKIDRNDPVKNKTKKTSKPT